MTEKQMKHYVRSLYKYKKITDIQFRNAFSDLKKIRDNDMLFYYFNMGKLYSAYGNLEKAVFYLNEAIKLKEDNPAAYYNLYKCYVKMNDIKKAKNSFERFLEINTVDVNFEFVSKIMNAIDLIGKDFSEYVRSDFSVSYISKLGYNNLDDNNELKDIYFEVLKCFNARNYLECINKLKMMNVKINETNYPMEVDTLIQLVKNLKDKAIIYYRTYLESEKSKEISDEMYANILLYLYKLGSYSTESFLRKIEEIILCDSHVKGELILDKISTIKGFENNQDMINYLRGIVNEKTAFLLLEQDKRDEFISKRLVAKNQYLRKQNELSLESYLELKNEFNLPICDYYIGKIMFRMGDFSEAKKYFLSYLEQGGAKAEKAYMFLAKIEKIRKNINESKNYAKMMGRIHDVFLRDFKYLSDKQYKKSKYINNDDDSIDTVKNKRMRTIKMKEEDFKVDESLSVADFDDTNIDGKLTIIKNLLRLRELEKARILLEKVQQECTPQERPKVLQFQRNTKLYMNQIRKN